MQLLSQPIITLLDSDGNPASGAFLYAYERGTTTLKPLFLKSGSAAPNPIEADAAGRLPPLFFNGAYSFRVTTKEGEVISDPDILPSQDSVTDIAALRERTISTPATLGDGTIWTTDESTDHGVTGDDIQSVVGNNGWLWTRVFEGGLTPDLYGATGDGAADDTDAVVAAAAAALIAGIPLSGAGSYLIQGDTTLMCDVHQLSLVSGTDTTVLLKGVVSGTGKMFTESDTGFITVENGVSDPAWWGHKPLPSHVDPVAPRTMVLEPLSILPSIRDRYVGGDTDASGAMDHRFVRYMVRRCVQDLGITCFLPFYLEFQTYSFAEGAESFVSKDDLGNASNGVVGNWYRFFNEADQPNIVPFDYLTVLLSEIAKYGAGFIVPTDRSGDKNLMNDLTAYLKPISFPTTKLTFGSLDVGTGVSVTAEFGAFQAADVGARLVLPNGGWGTITSFTSSTVVTLQVFRRLDGADPDTLEVPSGEWGIARAADPMRFGETILGRQSFALEQGQKDFAFYDSRAKAHGVPVVAAYSSHEPDNLTYTAYFFNDLKTLRVGSAPALGEYNIPLIASPADPEDMTTDPANADLATRTALAKAMERSLIDIWMYQDLFGVPVNAYTHGVAADRSVTLAQALEHPSEWELANRLQAVPCAIWRNCEIWGGNPATLPAAPRVIEGVEGIRRQMERRAPYVDALVLNAEQFFQFPNTPFMLSDVQPAVTPEGGGAPVRALADGEDRTRSIDIYDYFADLTRQRSRRASAMSPANAAARVQELPA